MDSENCSRDESDGHVHFRTEDLTTHQSDIAIVPQDGGIYEVHLGFLQVRHVYDVSFAVQHKLGQEVTFDPLENLLVKVKEMAPTVDGHQLLVEFSAHKEKLIKEKITLRSAISDDVIFLIFHARVLGKHKGTPSLRNGIHCVRIESDEDEETDWQGF